MFLPLRSQLWLLGSLGFCSLASADWRTDIGWDDYKDYLGPGYPDGSGVLVVQAEADANGMTAGIPYLPNSADGQMSGKTISAQTPGGSNSSHALNVARRFFGNSSSMAPGVTDIHVYEANSYITALASNTIATNRRVHCNAWIGNFSMVTAAANLASMDATINTRGYLVVGGLNNGSGTDVPHLFGTTYNALSVGRTSGGHSRNGTILGDGNYVAGRLKPEVVIPETLTSWSTGALSSAAAVLYEVAATGSHTNAEDNSEVMKAIIMAGATKQEFSGWDRSPSQPIDTVFGAGEVNIFNSYLILSAGENSPGASDPTGWSFDTIEDPPGPSSFLERSYDFTVPNGEIAEDFSVVLNWHYSGIGTPRDLKLELFSLTGGTVLLDESDSDKDNVEHIYRRHLAPGDYRLTVSRATADTNDDAIEFGLAWQSQFGLGQETVVVENINNLPEVTVTKIFKDQNYVIERSTDLDNWAVVHSFTPTTWADYVWEDPDGYTPGDEVFYRSGFTSP